MNRILLPLLLLILSVFGMRAGEFTYPVGQFSKLQIDDNVNVVYVGNDGSPSRLVYEGDNRFSKAFVITQKGDKLRVQVCTDFVNDSELPTLYIYSDFLKQVTNSSDSNVTIRSVAPSAEFSCTVVGNGTINVEDIQATKVSAKIQTGNGTISIAGHCQTAVFTMLGTGTIQADRLEATEVECKILGSGSIGCWPVNELKMRGIGSTKVYYKGTPAIDKKGGGSLYEIE